MIKALLLRNRSAFLRVRLDFTGGQLFPLDMSFQIGKPCGNGDVALLVGEGKGEFAGCIKADIVADG